MGFNLASMYYQSVPGYGNSLFIYAFLTFLLHIAWISMSLIGYWIYDHLKKLFGLTNFNMTL